MRCPKRGLCLAFFLAASTLLHLPTAARAQSAAPACGAVTDTTATYQVPAIPRPPLRTPIVDPTFGCTITRWTDASMALRLHFGLFHGRVLSFSQPETTPAKENRHFRFQLR